MNFIGFLKLHDSVVICSKDLDLVRSGITIDNTILDKVISYLRQGMPVFKFMGSLYSPDGEDMGQAMYLTDGEWIWPGYYAFYLAKYPNMEVPKAFLDHINMKGNAIAVSPDERIYADYMLARLLGMSIPKHSKRLLQIQYLIEARGEEIICY